MDEQDLLFEEPSKPSKYDGSGNIGDTANADTFSSKKIPMPEVFLDLESQIINLKYSLEDWREIILPIYSLLLWDKNWYPGAIVGGTSFLFLSLWLLDPSILTAISIIGLTATISDYLVPALTTSLFKVESWNNTKEKAYHDFCSSVIIYRTKISLWISSFYTMRTTSSKMFYASTIVTLAVLAWIGNTLNNLFLTYLLVTFSFLIPGMERHGILRKYSATLTKKLSECSLGKNAPKKDL